MKLSREVCIKSCDAHSEVQSVVAEQGMWHAIFSAGLGGFHPKLNQVEGNHQHFLLRFALARKTKTPYSVYKRNYVTGRNNTLSPLPQKALSLMSIKPSAVF